MEAAAGGSEDRLRRDPKTKKKRSIKALLVKKMSRNKRSRATLGKPSRTDVT